MSRSTIPYRHVRMLLAVVIASFATPLTADDSARENLPESSVDAQSAAAFDDQPTTPAPVAPVLPIIRPRSAASGFVSNGNSQIIVRPRFMVGSESEGAAPAPPVLQQGPQFVTAPPVDGRRYADVYRSIPFNRAEYDANRSYRHETTMELLFGQLRPMTIHKSQPVPVVTPRYPVSYPNPYAPVVPYRYNNRRFGMQYYFYFPYWNARGLY